MDETIRTRVNRIEMTAMRKQVNHPPSITPLPLNANVVHSVASVPRRLSSAPASITSGTDDPEAQYVGRSPKSCREGGECADSDDELYISSDDSYVPLNLTEILEEGDQRDGEEVEKKSITNEMMAKERETSEEVDIDEVESEEIEKDYEMDLQMSEGDELYFSDDESRVPLNLTEILEEGDRREREELQKKEREEAEKTMRELETERREEHDRRNNQFKGMTDEQIAEYYENRYRTEARTAVVHDDDDTYDDITQNGFLPSTKDPNLWIVECRMGEEKLVAMQLMRKAFAFENTEDPIQIKSIVVKEGLKGMVYIEAFKQSHVSAAIVGVSALNQFNVTMVPIKEMVDTLRAVKDIPQLETGSYVRLKRTMFKDDLAQVDWVDVAQNKVNLKLVPRIDYNRMKGALRTDADKNYKMKRRPGPKLFDLEKIKEIGGEVTTDGDFHIFEGNHYRRGFLYKSFPMDAIGDELYFSDDEFPVPLNLTEILEEGDQRDGEEVEKKMAEGVKPSLAELEKFQETNDDLKKELEQTTIKDKAHTFSPGDYVVVAEGELVNLRGRVETVDGDQVVLLPDHEDLKDPLTLHASELRKYFKPEDHVKVINGRYEGCTGLIVRVEENLAVVLSDLSMDEMKCRPRDVQLCAFVTTGVDSLGQFQYQDLVQIDRQTVAEKAMRVLETERREEHDRRNNQFKFSSYPSCAVRMSVLDKLRTDYGSSDEDGENTQRTIEQRRKDQERDGERAESRGEEIEIENEEGKEETRKKRGEKRSTEKKTSSLSHCCCSVC